MACHILGAPNMALQLGSPASVECIKKEGPSDFMFPRKSVIRYDFPARGAMPPVKLFWYDGMKETPKIPGVPDGAFLGDLPERRMPRPQGPPPYKGFIGDVFDFDKFEAVKNDPARRKTHAGWERIHRRQGYHHNRHLR